MGGGGGREGKGSTNLVMFVTLAVGETIPHSEDQASRTLRSRGLHPGSGRANRARAGSVSGPWTPCNP